MMENNSLLQWTNIWMLVCLQMSILHCNFSVSMDFYRRSRQHQGLIKQCFAMPAAFAFFFKIAKASEEQNPTGIHFFGFYCIFRGKGTTETKGLGRQVIGFVLYCQGGDEAEQKKNKGANFLIYKTRNTTPMQP